MTIIDILTKSEENIISIETLNELETYFSSFNDAVKEYNNGTSIMPDCEFDILSDKLISYNIESLTNYVGSTIYSFETNNLVDASKQEMISLKKIKYTDLSIITDIFNFFKSSKYYKHSFIYKAPKFDGCAIKITWNLKTKTIERIISRGGLDITKHFKNHPDFLNTICFDEEIITGELLVKKTTFNDKYSFEYENARNFVGSLIKQNSIDEKILNDLILIPLTNGVNILKTTNWSVFNKNQFSNLKNDIDYFKSDEFPFLCDGIVLGFDTEEREVKNNYPLNFIAIKFPSECVNTKVLKFEWTQKKSGNLTPLIIIEPVYLDGSTITKCSGYNYDYLIIKGIGIGSEITITKSGDIIPVVVDVLSKSKNINMPECDYIQIGKHLIANDLSKSKICKFNIGLSLLQIDGIGDVLSTQIGDIVDYDIIQLFNRIYKTDIRLMLFNKTKIWEKFDKNFYSIKNIYLDKLIELHQFDNVGAITAKKIALLITKKSTDTTNISENILKNVASGDGYKKIINSIQLLKSYGLMILSPVEINENVITFEMSGEPGFCTKAEFVEKMKQLYPNSIHTSLTKETKLLIVNDINSNTGKTNKARKYNVQIKTYQEILKLKS